MQMPILSSDAGQFLHVTASGCFHAVSSARREVHREALLSLLDCAQTPQCSPEFLGRNKELSPEKALGVYQNLQKAGLIEIRDGLDDMPAAPFEELFAQLLPSLSDVTRVVLADASRGFFLGCSGFTSVEAEELAVLSSRIRTVYEQSEPLLSDRLSIRSSAFGIIDPSGNSELGFWPCFVGDTTFVFVIAGLPQFNCREFRDIIWVLVQRYGHT